MRKEKKLLLFVAALFLMVGIVFQTDKVSADDGDVGGLTLDDWTYTEENDKIVLSEYTGDKLDVVIPSEFEGHEGKAVEIESLPGLFDQLKGTAQYNPLQTLKIGTSEKKVTLGSESLNQAFFLFQSLTSADLSGLDTSNITNMSYMFAGSGLISLDVSGFDTSKVTNMYSMFSCQALTSLNVSEFDTKNVTDMSYMFSGCSSLTSLDVSKFDTDNVTTMLGMFSGCSVLTSLDVSGFETKSVTDMSYMFSLCSSLTSLDVSKFDTDNVTTMRQMFYKCSGLTSLDVSGFDTSNVTNMIWMFEGCSGLTNLNISGFDTSNVESINGMFYGCSSLNVIDISNFDFSKISDMNSYKGSDIFSCDSQVDDPIPTLILCSDEKLIDKYDASDSIPGRTPFLAKVTCDANSGTFEDGSTTKEHVVAQADHFVYNSLDEAKETFSVAASDVLKEFNPSDSVSKSGNLFNGWYEDKDSTVPFTSDGKTVDFTSLVKGTLTLYAGWTQPIQARDLIVYEGGSGTELSGNADALPEPQWTTELEAYDITVDDVDWDMEAQGAPFDWEYRDANGDTVTASALAGEYTLYALPREDDKDVRLDGSLLVLPEDGIEAATVTVRDITDNDGADSLSGDLFKAVYKDGDQVDLTDPHARVKAGTIFYKNGDAAMPLNEGAQVALLWDGLLEEVLGSDARMEVLHKKALTAAGELFDEKEEVHREFRYLDLVDTNDGNLWVGTEKEAVTIYYPYPEGTDKDDLFAVVSYAGLTRDYTVNMESADLDALLDASNASALTVTKTDTGILFDIPSKQFGPIEVMWQVNADSEEEPDGPSKPSDTPDDEDDPNLNPPETSDDEKLETPPVPDDQDDPQKTETANKESQADTEKRSDKETAVQTGDPSDPVLWMSFLGLSAAALGTAAWKRRRSHHL